MATKSKEKTTDRSLLQELRQMTGSDTKAYWIMLNFCPDLLPDGIRTYEDLANNYTAFKGLKKKNADKYIYNEGVQTAIKWLLKRMDAKRDMELYNKYYQLALDGDTQALRAYMEFKKTFFEAEETSEIEKLIRNANISAKAEGEDDFEMEI